MNERTLEPLRQQTKFIYMTQDSDYFRRRAAEARALATSREAGDRAEAAGDLARAYAALAKRRAAAVAKAEETPAIPLDA